MQDAPAPSPVLPATDEPEESGAARMLRALRSRNYRLFFFGQGVSLLGTWLSNVATAWLVYRLSRETNAAKSAALLGLVGFATQAPLFFLSPFTGVMVDRWPKRTIMVITQTFSMLQSAALAILTLGGWITIPQVIVLAVFQGIVNAFDVPARQAFVVEMVEDRADLANAIALNSTMFNSARLLGPAVAGILIAAFSEGVCFAIDAVSYLAVILGLLAMHLTPDASARERKPVLRELKEGFAYSFGFPPTRALLLMAGLISFLGSSLSVLLPIFADSFSGHQHGERYLGFLTAGMGFGALMGGIYLASRRTVVGLGRVVMYCSTAYGVALLLFTRMNHIYTALPSLALCGFCFMVTLASTNTMLQSMVDDDKRGRLMSFFSMMVMGMSPLGALLAGTVASRSSVAFAVGGAGVCCVMTGAWFGMRLPAMRPLVRPIYVRKGIIKEISEAIQSAEVPGAEEK
jgi:MFS family permease